MEEIRDQVKIVAEGAETNRESLENKIGSVRTELKQDINDVVNTLSFRIDGVEKRLSEKIDGIGVYVDRHEEDIRLLKKAQ